MSIHSMCTNRNFDRIGLQKGKYFLLLFVSCLCRSMYFCSLASESLVLWKYVVIKCPFKPYYIKDTHNKCLKIAMLAISANIASRLARMGFTAALDMYNRENHIMGWTTGISAVAAGVKDYTLICDSYLVLW